MASSEAPRRLFVHRHISGMYITREAIYCAPEFEQLGILYLTQDIFMREGRDV